MKIEGMSWTYGDDINTDLIFPGKYTYTLRQPEEIANHALEDLDPTFVANVRPGDMIVGGRNWGCGSSREQAVTCLVYNGIRAVVAVSFNRIFYRNAINNGLLAISCPKAAHAINGREQIVIDLDQMWIQCAAETFSFPALNATVLEIIRAGGLVAHVQQKLNTV